MADKRGKYSAEIERLQREATADGFPITIDGIDGPETKTALEAYRQGKAERQRQQAERDRANSAAQAAAAAAEAERSKAEAEKTRAAAEIERAKADERKRADNAAERDKERQAAEWKQNKETAVNVAAIAAGMGIGHKLAKGISAKDKQALAELSAEMKKSGAIVEASLDTLKKKTTKAAAETAQARIRGAVAAVDKLSPKGVQAILRNAGRLGLLKGGALLAEGIYLRSVVAPEIKSEDAKLLTTEAGTSLALAGGATIADRTTAMATAKPLDARAMSRVEAGRAFVAAKDAGATGKAAAAAAKTAAKAAPAVEKAALKAVTAIAKKAMPVVGIVAAVATIVTAAKAAGANAEPAQPVGETDDLRALAKAQAAERAMKTGVSPAEVAAEMAGAQQGATKDQANGPLPTTSSMAVGALERGTIDPRQAALVAAVGQQGLDAYYAGYRPEVMLAREPHQELAATAQREVAAQHEVVTTDPARYSPASPGAQATERRPHHVWDDKARAAAAEARRHKRGY